MRQYALMLFPFLLCAGDYDFDMSAIETKPYTLSGYLKGEHKYQWINEDSPMYPSKNKESMKAYLSEADFKLAYFKEGFKIDSEWIANYNRLDGDFEKEHTIAQLYMQYKFDTNHLIEVGKKSPKWGKGYYVNPIAFFDRKKNPDDPEASREGFLVANYRYNKSYEGDLKNLTFDLLYLQTGDGMNEDFYTQESQNFGAKLYMLYYDTDIEFIYYHSDILGNKVGFDFSKNLLTNFEVHGEFAKTLGEDDYAYLLGLKYLTEFDLTITSEYYFQKNQSAKDEPFYDHQYLITKLSQNEPFEILYSGIYYKNIYNLEDSSSQNSVGATYKFRSGAFVDLSFTMNDGQVGSEYGSKLVQDTLWTKLYWYF
jgi:hypothetical protein